MVNLAKANLGNQIEGIIRKLTGTLILDKNTIMFRCSWIILHPQSVFSC